MKATTHVAMITLHLALDKRRSKKDGTYPLVFRLTSNGSSREISTTYTSLESDWSNRTGSLKDSHPLFTVISPRLKELELFYLGKIIEYEKQYPTDLSVQNVKEYLCSVPEEPTTVYSFWIDEISKLKLAKRNSGAIIYEEALNAIQKVKSLNVYFENIDFAFLRSVETSFYANDLSINSVGLYMRTFRAIFNKAIKSKIVLRQYYPFEDYVIQKQKTTPRPITLDELGTFFRLNIEKSSYLYDSFLMGKLMFLLIGINFKDMILLDESCIKDGRINYTRSKTKTLYTIKMLQDVIEIINYFKGRDKHTLLGKLTKQDLDNIDDLPYIIKQKNKVFNAHLNKFGKMIGCNEKLTGYVFRYTWANIAKQLGFSHSIISQALGHQHGSATTNIYLQAHEMSLVDEANHMVHLTVTMPEITTTL